MFRAGLVINPVAGCGQLLNLKGSDSLTPSECPRSLSLERAVEFLMEIRGTDAEFYTASGYMGEDAFRKADFQNYHVIYDYGNESSSSDTRKFVGKLKETGAEVLVFFGGDGTARDLIDSGLSIPALGVPLGTKMFSSVFAISVNRAIEVFRDMAGGKIVSFSRSRVIDLDEAAYSAGRVELSEYGELLIPVSEYIMSESKAEYPSSSTEAMAQYIVDHMERDVNYIIGPGSTCKEVNSILGLQSSVLGFDCVRDGELVGLDLPERDIYHLTEGKTVIILSPIGGQGFLIGRGNKQLSPRVLSRVGFENIMTVASEEKLRSLKGLYVDISGPGIEKPRFLKVLFSYGRYKLMPVLY